MLPKPRAVLFDWDNTLVNTWPVIHEALHQTFVEMGGTPWTIEEVKQRVRRSMRDSFPEIFGDRWERAAAIYQDRYRAIHMDKIKPLPSAEVVLKLLRGLPVHVGVVSNKRGINLRKEIEHLSWKKYFASIVGADDAERDKPHAEPVLLALKDSGISPGPEVWLVGDSEIDLECAQATGITPILYGPVEMEEGVKQYANFPFAHHTPDHASLSELLKSVYDK